MGVGTLGRMDGREEHSLPPIRVGGGVEGVGGGGAYRFHTPVVEAAGALNGCVVHAIIGIQAWLAWYCCRYTNSTYEATPSNYRNFLIIVTS